MFKNLGVVIGLVAAIVAVIALAIASSSYSRFASELQAKSDEMKAKNSEVHAEYKAVQAKYREVCALLEGQRKADDDRKATINGIRSEYEAASTALTGQNAKLVAQYAESAKAFDAQLAEARKAREEAEEKYKATVTRVKDAAELIRFRELQVIYPELRRFDGKKLDINEKYLVSVEPLGPDGKVGGPLRECVAVYDNQTKEAIRPRVKVTFLNEFGIAIGDVDLGWMVDEVDPGDRRTWAKPVYLKGGDPVYWLIEVESEMGR